MQTELSLTPGNIPRVIFQTSREKPSPHHIQYILRHSPNWKYVHFDDAEMYQFVEKHHMPEFPNMGDKLRSIPRGCHRADLFRYFFLYLYGGVFIDYDAMIYKPMDVIAGDASFFTVKSGPVENSTFQGLLGVPKYHPIIYLALYDAYHIDIKRLEYHHTLCENLYKMLVGLKPLIPYTLYQEVYHTPFSCKTVNAAGDVLLVHFWALKRVDYNLIV